MFSKKSKFNRFSKHNTRIALSAALVVLVIGLYFAFRPFPAGPSLEVKANVPEAASIVSWSAYANPPGLVQAAELQRSSSSAVQRLDIGAGYVLENSTQGSKIVAPSSSLPAVNSTFSAVQKIDIGAGYVLENSAQGSKIVAPNTVKAASASVQKLDIGAGYVLEFNSTGGQIVAPANAYSASAAQEPGSIPSFTLDVMTEDQRGFAPANVDSASTAQEPGSIPSFTLEVITEDQRSFAPANVDSASTAQGPGSIPSFTLGVMSEDQQNFAPAATVQRLDIGAGYVLEISSMSGKVIALNTPFKALATAVTSTFLQKIDIGSGYMLVIGPDNGEIVPAR